MLEKDLRAAVKSVLGTAASVGILVESEEPNELIGKVNEGAFEKEISEELSETSPEKRKKLDQKFQEVKAEQEAKAAEAAKAAEEEAAAKAAEAAAEGEVPVEGETPTEGEAPIEEKPTEEKPAEEKKE